jgi:hypothetical protein
MGGGGSRDGRWQDRAENAPPPRVATAVGSCIAAAGTGSASQAL